MSGWKRQVNARIAAGAYVVPVVYQQTVPESEKVVVETHDAKTARANETFFQQATASKRHFRSVSEGLRQFCITPVELFFKRSTCIVPVILAWLILLYGDLGVYIV